MVILFLIILHIEIQILRIILPFGMWNIVPHEYSVTFSPATTEIFPIRTMNF